MVVGSGWLSLPADLVGKVVRVVEADDYSMIIEVDGKRVRIDVDIDCEYWDECSDDIDAFLHYEIIGDADG